MIENHNLSQFVFRFTFPTETEAYAASEMLDRDLRREELRGTCYLWQDKTRVCIQRTLDGDLYTLIETVIRSFHKWEARPILEVTF